MRVKRNNNHDFHFVLSKELKEKIKSLSKRLKKSMSGTSVYVIKKSLNFFKKIYFTEEESLEISHYQNIYWDEKMHLFMDKNIYRKIKHIAGSMSAFSIAIIVRWLINYYFENLYDIENNKEDELKIEKMKFEIFKYENITKKWNKNIKNKQLSGIPYYQLTFNDKFVVIGFNFLNSV
jgi:predicted DNA-binding protein